MKEAAIKLPENAKRKANEPATKLLDLGTVLSAGLCF